MMFSEQIYTLRKENNMTQEDLAEKCEVSRQAVAKWESGESIPDIYKILQIARLFELSLDELVCGEQHEENKKEAAKKIYKLFAQNMENHIVFMKSGGHYVKLDRQYADEALVKKLRTMIRQARILFPKKTIDELLSLTEDFAVSCRYIFDRECYKESLRGNERENIKEYCECILPERYDRIELILKDYLDLP